MTGVPKREVGESSMENVLMEAMVLAEFTRGTNVKIPMQRSEDGAQRLPPVGSWGAGMESAWQKASSIREAKALFNLLM